MVTNDDGDGFHMVDYMCHHATMIMRESRLGSGEPHDMVEIMLSSVLLAAD